VKKWQKTPYALSLAIFLFWFHLHTRASHIGAMYFLFLYTEVGKSTLLQRYVTNQWMPNCTPTVGMEFGTSLVDVSDLGKLSAVSQSKLHLFIRNLIAAHLQVKLGTITKIRG
jgi:hypothetical protein